MQQAGLLVASSLVAQPPPSCTIIPSRHCLAREVRSTAANSPASGLRGPPPTPNLLIGHGRAAAKDPLPVSDPTHVRQSNVPAKAASALISDDLVGPANAH
jgi:hypothetical protein